jgi:hypothetical protein
LAAAKWSAVICDGPLEEEEEEEEEVVVVEEERSDLIKTLKR